MHKLLIMYIDIELFINIKECIKTVLLLYIRYTTGLHTVFFCLF